MLFGVPFDFLQMFVVAVLCKPGDDILVGPINLESMTVLVVNVVLRFI